MSFSVEKNVRIYFNTLWKIFHKKLSVYHMSRDTRKPVFGVSNKVWHKLTCTVTEAG